LSSVETRLHEIAKLIIHGDFQQALDIIKDELKKSDLTKEEKHKFLVRKCEIKVFLGQLEEAIAIADEVLHEIKDEDNILIHVDALVQRAFATLVSKVIFDEALEDLEKGFELLKREHDLSKEEIAERKSLLYYTKGMILHGSGDIQKGCKLIEESIPFAEASGNKRILARCLIGHGYHSMFIGNKQKTAEAFEKAYGVVMEIGNKLELALYYLLIAAFEGNLKEYEKSLDSYKKGYSLLDEIGSTLFYTETHNNLALVYRATYQLDKALESLQIALDDSKWGQGVVLSNIANLYYLKYDLKKAKQYYLKALKTSEKENEFYSRPGTLYSLIVISIDLKENQEAKKYLDELEQISQKTGFEHIKRTHYFASIIVLKANGAISDLVEATKMLNDYLSIDDLSSNRRLDALYALLEIRIKELQITSSAEALEEVRKQAIRLEVEAKERQYQWLLGNVYRLQSQLALIDMDADKALDLLKKAENNAIETKNDFLKAKVSEDLEKINQQLGMLQKLQERKAPISESVKLASLEKTMQGIKQETVLEERDEETGKIIEYRKLFALKI
jgi:tetratricopeptide (TPR) repeat protein